MTTTYNSLRIEYGPATAELTIDRPEQHNALSRSLIEQLHAGLDEAEADRGCRVVVLKGAPGTFCTGMDLAEASAPGGGDVDGGVFYDLLDRITRSRRVIVSVVDGQASGGGVGLVAATDIAFATPRSTFTLPEALWGLLPCIILPFLARRVGWHRARLMTLTTQPVQAADAQLFQLIDDVCDEPVRAVRRLALRLAKLDEDMTFEAKRYVGAVADERFDTRRLAVAELSRLMASPRVGERMRAFVNGGTLPWETA